MVVALNAVFLALFYWLKLKDGFFKGIYATLCLRGSMRETVQKHFCCVLIEGGTYPIMPLGFVSVMSALTLISYPLDTLMCPAIESPWNAFKLGFNISKHWRKFV